MDVFKSIILFIPLAIITFFAVVLTLLQGQIQYIPLIIAVPTVTYLLATFLLLKFFKTKRRILAFSIIAGAALIVTAIVPIRESYKQSMPTVSAEIDVYQYEPFRNLDSLAKLDHPATLKIQEPVPKLDGATALYPLYASFTEALYPKKEYYPTDSDVMVNTTPEAYNNLLNGSVDVIFAAGPSDGQKKTAQRLKKEMQMTPIGKEAFVFFVNSNNPVDSLTVQQIQDIYAGKITNWKEVDGNNETIRAFQRPADSGSQTALERFMGDVPIMKAPEENVPEGMGGIIKEVSTYRNYTNAIGFSFRYYSMEMVGNDQIKLIQVEDIAPTKETIRSGEYPISSEFYAVTAGTKNPNVQPLIDWIVSDEGQELVEKTGYVSLDEH
ncbi:PstS family phosphate ABC transporter substrate-binding protein [Sporosarcina aquimarina]|uniref:Substrate-binding domain-containing protein n=1 Tax=Sporosarcina aquimarina TaxID=114975 RepID=A0ABU4FVM6_9BACL|nr:substrate-binding domain-containing protein [Sporosarcina aquimarina]MDW0108771.1 substrate-binding domain-containing protein [Sporosarcina aquimarina]